MHNNYFEGTLQLRNANKEIVRFIEKKVEQEPGVFISKKAGICDGYDFFVSSRKFLHKIAKLLKRKYPGELKESPQLFSRDRQTSKDIYRVNILFRLCKLRKNDTILVRGEKIKILKLDKKIHGKVIKTNKKVTVDYKELN